MLMKLKSLQSKLVFETRRSWSFSKTLSIVLAIGVGANDYQDLIDLLIEKEKKGKKK